MRAYSPGGPHAPGLRLEELGEQFEEMLWDLDTLAGAPAEESPVPVALSLGFSPDQGRRSVEEEVRNLH